MDMSLRAFHSEELQAAINVAGPIIDNLDAARDRISSDIKNLEAYLQGLGLNVPFEHRLCKCFVPPEDGRGEVAASLEYSGSACGQIEEEVLAWRHDKTGKFRLLFE